MSNLLAPIVDQASIDQLEAAYRAPSATPRPIRTDVTREAPVVVDQRREPAIGIRGIVAVTLFATFIFGAIVLVALSATA